MDNQQRTAFDQWFDSELDPELNLTPGDKELCRHAWQHALEWAAKHGGAPTAPQVVVPEGWTDRHTRVTRFALWMLINEGYHRANIAAQKGQPGTADDAAALLDDVERAEEARSMLAAPTAPAGEPCQGDVEIPGDDGLDIHAPEQPVSDPDGLTEPGRREAEQAYINCAFDYARDPIGSRDWILFWNGWRARNKAAPAPNEREIAARALDKVAKELALRAIPGGVDDALERSFCVNTLRSEAARLRAGKEDRT